MTGQQFIVQTFPKNVFDTIVKSGYKYKIRTVDGTKRHIAFRRQRLRRRWVMEDHDPFTMSVEHEYGNLMVSGSPVVMHSGRTRTLLTIDGTVRDDKDTVVKDLLYGGKVVNNHAYPHDALSFDADDVCRSCICWNEHYSINGDPVLGVIQYLTKWEQGFSFDIRNTFHDWDNDFLEIKYVYHGFSSTDQEYASRYSDSISYVLITIDGVTCRVSLDESTHIITGNIAPLPDGYRGEIIGHAFRQLCNMLDISYQDAIAGGKDEDKPDDILVAPHPIIGRVTEAIDQTFVSGTLSYNKYKGIVETAEEQMKGNDMSIAILSDGEHEDEIRRLRKANDDITSTLEDILTKLNGIMVSRQNPDRNDEVIAELRRSCDSLDDYND